MNAVELGDRGRVPFALVGVVLLVTSALFAAATGPAQRTTEPAVDTVVERTTADARAAFRDAVSAASVDAAASPVISNASTAWGSVLNESQPFRDALRVRIYVAARERFESIERTNRGLEGSASLAPTPTPDALRRAKRRVHLSRPGETTVHGPVEGANVTVGGSQTRLRATIENVSVRASDGNRTVGQRNVTLSVTVPTPVLAVHDRVERFQGRLNAGLTEPGLARQLTARLYAVAYARGYAQWGGLPISNVVTNRHIELLTNGALLDQQAATFGASDPDGRDAFGDAMGGVLLGDLTAPVGGYVPELTAFIDERVRAATSPTENETVPRVTRPGQTVENQSVAAPEETVNVTVGISADRAFRRLISQWGDADVPGGGPNEPNGTTEPAAGNGSAGTGDEETMTGVNETIQSVYSASVGVAAATENVSGGVPSRPSAPPGAEVVERGSLETQIRSVSPAESGPRVVPRGKYHSLTTYDRRVTLEHTREIVVSENGTNRTIRRTATQVRRVRLVLVGRHAQTQYAPENRINPIHERGGEFDGPNLANVTARARERLVNESGGPDALARRAVRGSLGAPPWNGSATTIETEWPDELWRSVRKDLMVFREEIRNVTEAVPRGELGTYQVQPAMELREWLVRNRTRLLDVPDTYDGAASKAHVAVRGRFFAAVLDRLAERADRREETRSDFRDRLNDDSSPASFGTVQDSYGAYRDAVEGNSTGNGSPPPSSRLDLRVDGAPPYLTTRALEHEDVTSIAENETVYPMVAQNVNLVTIPYADVARSLLSGLLGGGPERRTDLETAGRALEALNESARRQANESFARNRTRLSRVIRAHLYASGAGQTSVVELLADELAEYGVNESRQVVRDVLEQWDTVHERAIAVGTRSVVDPLVKAAEGEAEDGTLDSEVRKDELRVDLRALLSEKLQDENFQLDAESVERATRHLEAVAGPALERGIERELPDRRLRTIHRRNARQLSRLPAGIPLAPIPGAWVATAGIWAVEVRGEYQRFAVEAPRQTPDADDTSLSYVRDGENVSVDVNGDGQRELLGTADRVSFDVETAVVVVVPPYSAGVGDTDGVMVENSPGWPYAGPESEWPEPCLQRLQESDGDGDLEIPRSERAQIRASPNPAYACRNAMNAANSSVPRVGGYDGTSAVPLARE